MRNLTLALAVLLAASCTQATGGIFAGIESEQKVVSLGGMNKYASIFSMAEDTTTAADPTYYAAGGKLLFSKTASATVWTGSPVGGSSDVAAVGAVANVVYAVANGTLYKLITGVWTAQTLAGGEAAENLVPVIGPDGHSVVGLYVVTLDATAGYTKLYRINASGALGASSISLLGGALPAATSLPAPGITSAVATGTTEATQTDIVADRSYLWDISTLTATPTVTCYRPTGAPGSEYAGLLYVNTAGGSEQKLLLSVSSNASTGGGIYYATVAANAGASAATFATAGSGSNLTYGSSSKAVSPAEMRLVSGSVWVGTVSGNATYEGNGILQVSGLSGTPSVSVTPSTSIVTSSNYASTYLYEYATPVIFQTSLNTVFLGTAAHGLWKWNTSSSIFEQQ